MTLIAILIAGLSLLIGGFLAGSTLTEVIGGSILGAAFSTYFSKIAIERYMRENQAVLKATLGTKFCGDETKAANHRKKWHLYQ